MRVTSKPKAQGNRAISGVGESFRADHQSGSANISVPIHTTAYRNSQPVMDLSYSSGAGNSVFGIGFDVAIPRVSCKTDAGIPRYDGTERYSVSGAGEVIPVLDWADPKWVRRKPETIQYKGNTYLAHPYRSRSETTFSRIDKCIEDVPPPQIPDVFWRVIDRNNHTQIFGHCKLTREADPKATDKIFTWLLERQFDPRGNVTTYQYRPDPSPNGGAGKLHIEKVCYGRYLDSEGVEQWHFQIIFDYSTQELESRLSGPYEPDRKLKRREDMYCSYQAGFAQRTSLLCNSILTYHRFDDQPEFLVRAMFLDHILSPTVSKLKTITETGIRDDKRMTPTRELPEIEFHYTQVKTDSDFRQLTLSDGSVLREAVDQFTDVMCDGLPGLIMTHGDRLRYARPLGNGQYSAPEVMANQPIAGVEDLGTFSLTSLNGDGALDLVDMHADRRGYYCFNDGSFGQLNSFDRFASTANTDQMHSVDLTGDGRSDLVEFTSKRANIYVSAGTGGCAAELIQGPELPVDFPFTRQPSAEVYVGFVDLVGDGGGHAVEVSGSSIKIWPSLGWGRFDDAITLSNEPIFGPNFDPMRLQFANVDGMGPVDLLYHGVNGVIRFANLAGNGFGAAESVAVPDGFGADDHLRFSDILGNGTACLVAEITTPDGKRTHWFRDLAGGQRPNLLHQVTNGMGLTRTFTYASSITAYLEDRVKGVTGARHPPTPIPVLSQIDTHDEISGSVLSTSLKYRQGYFDPVERCFHGFELIETLDHVEQLAATGPGDPCDQEPVLTREWFHTGRPDARLSDAYRQPETDVEYRYYDPGDLFGNPGDSVASFAKGVVDDATARLAVSFSLRGKLLRSEEFVARGFVPGISVPIITSEISYGVKALQGVFASSKPVCFAAEQSSLVCHLEDDPADPRMEQKLSLAYNEYGALRESAHIYYPRVAPIIDDQARARGTVDSVTYVPELSDRYNLLSHLAAEMKSYEISGLGATTTAKIWSAIELEDHLREAEIGALLSWRKSYFLDVDGDQFEFGDVPLAPQGLHFRTDTAVFPENLGPDHLAQRLTDARLGDEARLKLKDGCWWQTGNATAYDMAPDLGFPVIAVTDPFMNATTMRYSPGNLFLETTVKPGGATEHCEFDLYTCEPSRVADANGIVHEILYDQLGQVAATSVYTTKSAKMRGDDPLVNHAVVQIDRPQEGADHGGDALGRATSAHFYELNCWKTQGIPPWVLDVSRADHLDGGDEAGATPVIEIRYLDGFGATVQSKECADPGPAIHRDSNGAVAVDQRGQPVQVPASRRWRASGWAEHNNKGLEIRRYDPFYTPTIDYEDDASLRNLGTSHHSFHDAVGRLVKVELPNGTFTEDKFGAWWHSTADATDTLARSQLWNARNDRSKVSVQQAEVLEDAARLTEAPDTHDLDVQGLVARSTLSRGAGLADVVTEHHHDLDGQLMNSGFKNHPPAVEHIYDLTGKTVWTNLADAGQSWTLYNSLGIDVMSWSSGGHCRTNHLDDLSRVVAVSVVDVGPNGETLSGAPQRFIERRTYGKKGAREFARNTFGRVTSIVDQSGLQRFYHYDICGAVSATLVALHADPWPADALDVKAPPRGTPVWRNFRRYDAYGRTVQSRLPHNVTINYEFGREGFATSLAVSIGDSTVIPVLTRASHSALGERRTVHLGNGIVRNVEYDLETGHRASQTTSIGANIVQSLKYLTDPSGNLALKTEEVLGGLTRYSYDSLDQLLRVENDNSTLSFEFDQRGNLVRETNTTAGMDNERINTFGNETNRLLHVQESRDAKGLVPSYDAHGNITGFGPLTLTWDTRDQLIRATDSNGTTSQYRYDASGNKRLQVINDGHGNEVSRISQIANRRVHTTTQGKPPAKRTETHRLDLHDDQGLLAFIEYKVESGVVVDPAIRFQIDDYVGSIEQELSGSGKRISARHYAPFGTQEPKPDKDDISAGFIAKDRDSATGFIDFGARLLAPELGRWISPDPARTSDGLNLYEYGHNNPISVFDPDGRMNDNHMNARTGRLSKSSRTSSSSSVASPSSASRAAASSGGVRTSGSMATEPNRNLDPNDMRRGGMSHPGLDMGKNADAIASATFSRGQAGKKARKKIDKSSASADAKAKLTTLHAKHTEHQETLPPAYHQKMASSDKWETAGKVAKTAAKTGSKASPVPGTGAVAAYLAETPFKRKAATRTDEAATHLPSGSQSSQMDRANRLRDEARSEHLRETPFDKVKTKWRQFRNGDASQSTAANIVSVHAAQGTVNDTRISRNPYQGGPTHGAANRQNEHSSERRDAHHSRTRSYRQHMNNK